MEDGQELCDTRSISVPGHFAERHFAESHFAERHLAERGILPTDTLSNEHFVERTV